MVNEISINLKECKFLKCYSNQKIPIVEKNTDWEVQSLSYNEANMALKDGLNVALLCNKRFIAIDVDDVEMFEKLKDFGISLETYTEKTTSGGIHLIYELENNSKIELSNFEMKLKNKHYGEFRYNQQIIVIAPSKAESKIDHQTHQYEVLKDVKPAVLKANIIKRIEKYFAGNKLDDIIKNPDIESLTKEDLVELLKYKIHSKYLKLILDGSSEELKFPSRSERDQAVVNHLVNRGLRKYVYKIFELFPIGDKFREKGNSGQKYLEATIESAKEFTGIEEDIWINALETINEENETKLRLKVDDVLRQIKAIKHDIYCEYLLGLLAYKIKVGKRELKERLKKILENENMQNPIQINDLLKMDMPVIEYNIDPIVPKNKVILVGGKPGSFKSLWVLSLLLSMKTQKAYLTNFKINEINQKILLYDLENGENVIAWRFKYLLNGLNKSSEELKDLDILCTFNKANLKRELEIASKYDIIVLDSYRRFLSGSENDSEITNKFFEEYIKPLKELGKTIIIIHHFKKTQLDNELEEQDLQDLFRGNSDIPAQFDIAYGVYKNEEITKIESKILSFDVNIVKFKNRLGLPIKNFVFNVIKDDNEQKTYLTFKSWNKLEKPKDRIKNRIIEFVTEAKDLVRDEILTKIKSEFDISDISVDKYLKELIRDGIFIQRGFGVYSLKEIEKKNDKNQKDDYSTIL